MSLVLARPDAERSLPPVRPPSATVPSGRSRSVTQRLSVLFSAVAAAVVAGIFLVTPDGTGFLQGVDDAALGSGATRWAAGRGAILTPSLVVPALAALVAAIAFALSGSVRRAVSMLAALALAVAGALVPALIVGRPAPGGIGVLAAASVEHSFPSVAAAMTAAVVITMVTVGGRGVTVNRLVAGGAVVALASSIRVVTGSTWLLDELAGIVLGAMAADVVAPWRVARRHRRPPAAACVVAAAVVASLLVPTARSYLDDLGAPGDVSVAERTVEFLRDHGLGVLVDRTESWWLWSHLPPSHGRLTALPAAPLVIGPATSLPPSVRSVLSPPLPGEGRWTASARDAAGHAEIATTTLRPDRNHPTIVAAVAWLNHRTTRLALFSGLREPGGGPGPAGAKIPAGLRGQVLAAFNSGYRMKDTPGGTVIEGHHVGRLEQGLATAVIRPDGSLAVGEWGRDLDPHGHYAAIRQNLHLMVRHGKVLDGVATNAGGRWGTVRNTLPTWRSGLGVTASGDAVYVAGNQLTLGVLADTLVRAGAVTAMELDIHRDMVTFNLFTHRPELHGHKLLPNMTRRADRYLRPDWRDFFIVAPG